MAVEAAVPLAKFLRPLDVLLLRPHSAIGWLIAVKTWNKEASHVEVVAERKEQTGQIVTFAARGAVSKTESEQTGVNFYADLGTLAPRVSYVVRPRTPWALPTKAYRWALSEGVGQGYDYAGLAVFALAAAQGSKGKMHCGEAVTRYLRQAGVDLFHKTVDADLVAPAWFLVTPIADQFAVKDGLVIPFPRG